MVGVLCQLEAEVPVRPVLERWLPGFDPAVPAAPDLSPGEQSPCPGGPSPARGPSGPCPGRARWRTHPVDGGTAELIPDPDRAGAFTLLSTAPRSRTSTSPTPPTSSSSTSGGWPPRST